MTDSSSDPDCVFCGIVAGTIPSTQVYADDRVVAFADINPASYGHSLVIPRAHSRDLLAVDDEDLTACTLAARNLARRAVDALDADGVNLLNCCGKDAWQSVFHFHLHVIPRYAGGPHADDLRLPWDPGRDGDPKQIAAAAAALRG